MPHIRPGVLERLDVRLVVVADDFIRQARCALLSTPKERFRGGRVAVLTQEYVHHVASFVDHAIEVVLEPADAHEHLIHKPPLPERETPTPDRLPQQRTKGLCPPQDGATRNVQPALREQLHHLLRREPIAEVAAQRRQDHLWRETIAAERAARLYREVASAGSAGITLPTAGS